MTTLADELTVVNGVEIMVGGDVVTTSVMVEGEVGEEARGQVTIEQVTVGKLREETKVGNGEVTVTGLTIEKSVVTSDGVCCAAATSG